MSGNWILGSEGYPGACLNIVPYLYAEVYKVHRANGLKAFYWHLQTGRTHVEGYTDTLEEGQARAEEAIRTMLETIQVELGG